MGPSGACAGEEVASVACAGVEVAGYDGRMTAKEKENTNENN